jgi:hypothetical protein
MDASDLKNLFHYDPDSGDLFWSAEGRGRIKKKPAGSKLSTGYMGVVIGPKRYLVHRVCWAIFNDRWPSDQIDHINGIKTDNRIANLREALNRQNGKNLKISSRNTSGVSGVYFDNWASRWRAVIKVDGQAHNLGRWHDKEDAVKARKEAEIKYFGEWARSRI